MTVKAFTHTSGGIDWYCETSGSGPWVVLIPSGEGDCANFRTTASLLADRFSVLTFDTPGYSRTSTPDRPEEVSVFALYAQIAALVRSLGIEQATFYGCSSGGRAVLDLVAKEPGLVRNALVHEAALPSPHMNAQLGQLMALDDQEVVGACTQIFAHMMNEDMAAWQALGPEYHERLSRNYLTWVRSYLAQGLGDPLDPAVLRARPLSWTIGSLSEQEAFAGNVSLAEAAGLPIGALPCRHFPQVSIPAALADHIASASLPLTS